MPGHLQVGGTVARAFDHCEGLGSGGDMATAADVVVIGDDPLFVATACELLRGRKIAVCGAGTAEEALAVLAGAYAPKLIVLDIVLPGTRARDILAAVKQEWPRTPVVLVAAGAVVEVPSGLQVDGVVRKPVAASQLVALVRRYCGGA
jgi:CheY-like chemotaxis protein